MAKRTAVAAIVTNDRWTCQLENVDGRALSTGDEWHVKGERPIWGEAGASSFEVVDPLISVIKTVHDFAASVGILEPGDEVVNSSWRKVSLKMMLSEVSALQPPHHRHPPL